MEMRVGIQLWIPTRTSVERSRLLGASRSSHSEGWLWELVEPGDGLEAVNTVIDDGNGMVAGSVDVEDVEGEIRLIFVPHRKCDLLVIGTQDDLVTAAFFALACIVVGFVDAPLLVVLP